MKTITSDQARHIYLSTKPERDIKNLKKVQEELESVFDIIEEEAKDGMQSIPCRLFVRKI